MSKEKHIDEMAKAICEHYVKGGCGMCPDCFCEGDALKLYNAGYRKQEWISVNERLPEGDGDFLVWNDFHGIIVGHYFARGKYFISKACTVTHWMPLPSMPKKEKNDD